MKTKSDLKKSFKKHWKFALLDFVAWMLFAANMTNLSQLWRQNKSSLIIIIAAIIVVASAISSIMANNIFISLIQQDLKDKELEK